MLCLVGILALPTSPHTLHGAWEEENGVSGMQFVTHRPLHPVCKWPCAVVRRQWIEARIQAAEEELEMPVVLEEFGSKLDKRCGNTLVVAQR